MSERRRAYAALIVAAARASGMDILMLTQARCMTIGWQGERALGGVVVTHHATDLLLDALPTMEQQ